MSNEIIITGPSGDRTLTEVLESLNAAASLLYDISADGLTPETSARVERWLEAEGLEVSYRLTAQGAMLADLLAAEAKA